MSTSIRTQYGLPASVFFFGSILIAFTTSPQASYIDDIVAHVDGARKLAGGAMLGRDFSSPIGPAAYIPDALLLRIGIAPGLAYSIGAALWFAIIASLAWIRTSKWEDPLPRWVFALGVALIAASPHRVGEAAWIHTTWALRYNALGLAISALCVLEICSNDQLRRGGALLVGFYAAMLFWLKITNVLCLLPIALGLLARSHGSRISAFGATIVGALMTTTVVYFAAKFSLLGYLRDCWSMATTSGTAESGKLTTLLRADLPLLLGPAAIASLWCYRYTSDPVKLRHALFCSANCFLLVLGLHLFSSTKPLMLLPLFLAVAAYHSRGAKSPVAAPLIVCLGALACAPLLASWLYCGAWTIRNGRGPGPDFLGLAIVSPPAPILNADSTSATRIIDTRRPEDNFALIGAYQDALVVARKYIRPTDTLIMADFANPVAAAGLARGMPGDWIAWHWNRNVGPRQLPWLDQSLQSADWVLTWLVPSALAEEKNTAVLQRVQKHHHVFATTFHWTLWQRNQPRPLP